MLWVWASWGRGEGLHLDPFVLRRALRLRPRRVACEHCGPESGHQPVDGSCIGETAYPLAVKLPGREIRFHDPPVPQPPPAPKGVDDLTHRRRQPSSLLPLQN